MSFMDDLLKGTLKHLGDCSPDASGEKYEKNVGGNGCKPAGSVTIPAGATLTIQKGGKFVDENTAEVVILPETEWDLGEASHTIQFSIATPLSATPVEGETYVVTVDGVAYKCPAIRAEMEGMEVFLFGNASLLGIEGGDTDTPVGVMLFPAGIDVGEGVVYGTLMYPDGDFRNHATLSIVEKAETASAGGGGGLFIVNCPTADMDAGTVTFDKTFEEVLAAYNAGQHVVARCVLGNGEFTLPLSAISNTEGKPSAIMMQGFVETSIFGVVMQASADGIFTIVPLID